MKPTNRLRFVERHVYVNKPAYNSDRGVVCELVKKMILQQWWEERALIGDQDMTIAGEWRDVPVEKEA